MFVLSGGVVSQHLEALLTRVSQNQGADGGQEESLLMTWRRSVAIAAEQPACGLLLLSAHQLRFTVGVDIIVSK